ncbi:MAG: hypothetical protein EAZ85_10530 [Bacteroidetes bacterium]|nr:MAG: hypothetical protein EAZ85_10530 [Bacteroidota bacterium]TAG88438.1 MAG: hypothetical protein EAZ20_08550 [Bacteroidota bacterium]
MNSREKILEKIKKALIIPTDKPIAKPDFKHNPYINFTENECEVAFAEAYNKGKGEFYFCETLEVFLSQLKSYLITKNITKTYIWEEYLQELAKFSKIDFQNDDKNFNEVEVGITLCEALVARTGSIVVSSKQSAGRRLTIFPPIHIVVAFTSQCVWEIKDALSLIKTQYENNFPSMVSFITGPSQTADIEKTLVLGAHGPKELILFLVKE